MTCFDRRLRQFCTLFQRRNLKRDRITPDSNWKSQKVSFCPINLKTKTFTRRARIQTLQLLKNLMLETLLWMFFKWMIMHFRVLMLRLLQSWRLWWNERTSLIINHCQKSNCFWTKNFKWKAENWDSSLKRLQLYQISMLEKILWMLLVRS
jgi:hypothetical protein